VIPPQFSRSLLALSLRLAVVVFPNSADSVMKTPYPLLSTALLAGGRTWGIVLSTLLHADQEAKVKGTISEMDHSSGRIELTTEKGPVQIYFIPETIKDLKAGAKGEVALELQKDSSTADAAVERDMEERFPDTTKPEEDIAKKSKHVGS
jgi:hypothetical protein